MHPFPEFKWLQHHSVLCFVCMSSLFHLPAVSPSCPFSCQCHFSVFGKLQRSSGSSVQNSHFHRALNAFWLLMMKQTYINLIVAEYKMVLTNKISTTYVLHKIDHLVLQTKKSRKEPLAPIGKKLRSQIIFLGATE